MKTYDVCPLACTLDVHCMSFGTENFKEAIKNNNIEHISWVKTNEQLADSLTNSGGGGSSSVPLS